MLPVVFKAHNGKTQQLAVESVTFNMQGMSAFYTVGKGSDEENLKVIARAHELGVTLMDTADVYGLGKNEQ